MKKTFKTLNLFILILTSCFTQLALATELLSGAKKQIELPEFNPDWLDNNLDPQFLALISMDDNALSIAHKFVQHNYNEFRNVLHSGDIDAMTTASFLDYPHPETLVSIDPYKISFPWNGRSYLKVFQKPQTILEDVYKKASIYNIELQKYRHYLQKRNTILNKNSYFYDIATYPLEDPTEFYPMFNIIRYLYISDLQIAQALLLIKQDEIDKALDIFLYEFNLAETMICKSNASFLSDGTQKQRHELIYSLLHDLFDKEIITSNHIDHPLFTTILNQDDFSDQFYYEKIAVSQEILPMIYLTFLANWERYKTINLPWDDDFYYLNFNTNETINMFYLFYQELLHNIESDKPLTSQRDEFKKLVTKYQENNQRHAVPDYYLNDVFDDDNYYQSNAQTYQNILLYLKSMESYKKVTQLKILSIKDQHTIESMTQLLDHENSPYVDAITQKPLPLDPKSGEISFTYYEPGFSNEANERQIILIPLIHQKSAKK